MEFVAEISDPGRLDTHTFRWLFEPGASIEGRHTMTYAYADDGLYTVTIDVEDDDGGIGSATASVTVQNVAPLVEAGRDQTVDEGAVVRFNGSFMDPGVLDTHTIEWDFGDGTNAANSLTPTHIYADDGEYTVSLSMIDSDGGFGSDTLTVGVTNKPPVVEIGQ